MENGAGWGWEGGSGRVESQRRDRSQDSRDGSCEGGRAGMGKVRVEMVLRDGGD